MESVMIATKNTHKLAEFRELLSSSEIEIRGLPAQASESPENGLAFETNALEKAIFYARYADGDLVLADDSGLAVDALDGRPGIHSARYSGVHGDDAANRRKLLKELAQLGSQDRSASFICAIALYHAKQNFGLIVRGEVSGVITTEEKGQGGFGYDPLFYVPSLGKTFAELSPVDKNRLSHRAKAVLALMDKWKGGV